jgi:hypothetical protein
LTWATAGTESIAADTANPKPVLINLDLIFICVPWLFFNQKFLKYLK